MRHSRSRKILFVSILGFAGILVSLLIGGVLLVTGTIRFERSEQLGRRFGVAEDKSKESRVLVLGDSFLSWWPIDHCLYKDLEDYCAQREIGLVNTAYGGFGPHEYLDQLQTVGAEFRPGLVLLFYYAGNDLTDVQYRPDESPRRPKDHIPQFPMPSDSGDVKDGKEGATTILSPSRGGSVSTDKEIDPAIIAGMETNVYATSTAHTDAFDWEGFLNHGIDPELIQYAQNRIRRPNRIGGEYVNPHLLRQALEFPSYISDNILMDKPENGIAGVKVRNLLERIHQLTKSFGADLCVVAIPSTVQVDRSHYAFYRGATFEVEEALLESTKPQELLAEFCRDADVQFVNLLPEFKAHPERSRLYWENDDHLSEEGHKLAFSIIRREFLDRWADQKPSVKE